MDATPDYSRYTSEELHDVAQHINKAKYPDRYVLVLEEIRKREAHQLSDTAQANGTKPENIPIPLVFVWLSWGPLIILFGAITIAKRASIGVDGVVTRSDSSCEQTNQTRCVTSYTMKSLRTGQQTTYKAGFDDASLQKNLPVGTQIHKMQGQLTYEINGRQVDDFPLFFYGLCMMVGFAVVVGVFTKLLRPSRKPT